MKKKFTKNFGSAIKKNVERQKSEEANYGYLRLPNGVNLFKESAGKVLFDIIPYIVKNKQHPDRIDGAEAGDIWYRLPYRVHKKVGIDNDAVICPTTFGKPCPICEYKKKRAAEGAEREELKEYDFSKRNLYVIKLKGKAEFMLWDSSNFLFQKQLNEELADHDEYGNFPSLTDGFTLSVRFEEQTFASNKFYKANRIDFVKRQEQYSEDVLDEVPCLDDVLSVKSYQQIYDLFFQVDTNLDGDSNEDEGDDEDEKPQPKTKTSSKTKVRPEPEDEDEEDDAEEEDEKPKSKSKSKPKPEPEDDEEDEDEEDEDDDEDDVCVACQGTGMNSKGRTCPICKGTGRKPAPEDEDDEEEEDEKPQPKAKSKAKLQPEDEDEKPKRSRKPTPSNKCPFGHTWGDADEHKECRKCSVWDACVENE